MKNYKWYIFSIIQLLSIVAYGVSCFFFDFKEIDGIFKIWGIILYLILLGNMVWTSLNTFYFIKKCVNHDTEEIFTVTYTVQSAVKQCMFFMVLLVMYFLGMGVKIDSISEIVFHLAIIMYLDTLLLFNTYTILEDNNIQDEV